MSVTALSRLLEAVAIATSKLLLENSGYVLQNAPVNAKSLFVIKSRKLLNLIMKRNNRDS